MAEELKVFTVDEVAAHKTTEDCWIVVGEAGAKKVYDVTKYLDDHPGGPEIILDLAGQDANEEFEDIGHSTDARKALAKYLIGTLKEEPKKAAAAKAVTASNGTSGGNTSLFLFPIIIAILALLYKMNN
ncbi:cytochrome-b5 reductase [Saprolegnia diclina VS20]|uniref:Cytochrome-b5 reductase n=1 Tax=Saprolegnia diclina (strain VS20) TaxID=1156394 RepID=T0RAL6_SAPDV|nr:cytochrome-b5 reductase [Saprolegnia diclina VS20]EQC29228.1 cytochrome-b5 reductase [Saprolegnia diclina VS20]|eukprot:XP_008617406.1 cytochrome-b5 reductase [Saprolegnia diclina VS20]